MEINAKLFCMKVDNQTIELRIFFIEVRKL